MRGAQNGGLPSALELLEGELRDWEYRRGLTPARSGEQADRADQAPEAAPERPPRVKPEPMFKPINYVGGRPELAYWDE